MAGAGFKTFNTGDVLTASDVNTYLMQQTVMVFADASARTTALGANLAQGMLSFLKSDNNLYKYNGSAWVNVDTGSTSPLTTKGDLYTYSTTDTRLPVGANGYTLVADSSTSTGLAYGSSAPANPIINGAFDVWQRGTSGTANSSAAGSGYNADRWQNFYSAANLTVSRQATGDTTNLPNIQYCARVQRNSGQTSTNIVWLSQTLETTNSIPLVGKTVTLSFYARRGANFSSSGNALNARLNYGTGTDENNFSFTGSGQTINQDSTLTTTWQRFSYTGTVTTTATELSVTFIYTPSGTAGAADYFEVTGVQIDLGSTALPFRRSGGTIQGELAACQRYYWKSSTGLTYTIISNLGTASTTGKVVATVPMKVTMRTAPTTLDYGNLQVSPDGVAALSYTVTSAAFSNSNITSAEQVLIDFNATGLTQYRPYFVHANNNTAGYLALGAEL